MSALATSVQQCTENSSQGTYSGKTNKKYKLKINK